MYNLKVRADIDLQAVKMMTPTKNHYVLAPSGPELWV